jgi:predicted DNA-binding helix-hairpin-helix protein
MSADLETKLGLLAESARFDLCNTYSQAGRKYKPAPEWVAQEQETPQGRGRPLLRVLMSSRCSWNCAYCPLRADNDGPRATLEPEELAEAFLPRFEQGAVEGLFLSTAVDGSVGASMQRMLDGVELLRTRHQFSGYVHVKLLAGADVSDVERAARLADRVSLNLEVPRAEQLQRLAPERDWQRDMLQRLLWARDWQRDGALGAGLATQFVVGAADERDRELLTTSAWLYRDLELRRVYFGPFRPQIGTPLAAQARTPQLRITRLQQADWMIRQYGFALDELPYSTAGDLPLAVDPKIGWALAHPEFFPLEINRAGRSQLLRVPGLGPLGVARILRLRKIHPFREAAHLRVLGTQALRALDYVTLDGRYFGRGPQGLAREAARLTGEQPHAEQLGLWE